MSNQLVSYDPSNGTAIGEVTVTAVSGVPDVVSRALTAQKSWRNISVGDRVALIAKASKLVEKQASELSTLLSREMGKDIGRSSGEVSGCIYGAPHIAQQVEQAIRPKQVSGSTIEYRPLGVAAVISPWNYPLMMAVNLMIPALVAGNTVVFKPSEETPLIAQAYVDLLNEVLPPDVLQIIHGGAEQGQALVESNVSIIAFTGSREAGIDIMRRASGSLKRLVMELGGNDPMLVTRDADIRAAARFAVASSFENAGQMCTSTERIYVDESVADEFEKQVTMIASQYNIGPWNQQRVNIGPIINQRQRSKIIMHIDDAVGKGARVLLGGKDHPEHYVTPTVIADVAPGMLMEQEETFGPVVSISRYSSLDQAIERANDSEYGLGAVVFTGADGPEIASKLEAGMVGINGGAGGGGDVPWVGAKQSGFGFHGSTDGHRQFTQVRVTR
jgi:acyl-CoA reductase-like NAD-dependent aldehyde dehydrogenase